MKRLLILLFILAPFSSMGQGRVVYDTIDFGIMYRKDTMGIYINIDNHFDSRAIIRNIYWKPTSDFTQINCKNGPLDPHENRPISFRIKNSVGRNAEIAKTLTVTTSNKTYHFFVTGGFKSNNAPKKEEIRNIPILKKIAKYKTTEETKVTTKVIIKGKTPKKPIVEDEIELKDTTTFLPDLVYTPAPKRPKKKVEESTPVYKEEEKEEEITKVVESPSRRIDNIIKTAGNLMGTPYLYGGTTTKGFDCSGFVQHCYKNENITLPRSSRTQFTVGENISISDAKPGDLVFFQGRKLDGVINHVGIIVYVDNVGIAFIHASTNEGVTISETSFAYYSERLVGIKRIL